MFNVKFYDDSKIAPSYDGRVLLVILSSLIYGAPDASEMKASCEA